MAVKKVVQVTSKCSIVHVLARDFNVNVQYLDRRWWELRPRMQVNIPYKTLHEMVSIQGKVLRHFINSGYSPSIHMRMADVDT